MIFVAKERTKKCAWCKISDTPKSQMEEVKAGEKNFNHYHKGTCYESYLQEKANKEKESAELDVLVEVIKKIYGVKVLGNNAYNLLYGIRNGATHSNKNNKAKKGYDFLLIAETFEYCTDTIEYWNAKKDFNGMDNALRYGLSIVSSKLPVVEKRKKEREKNKIAVEEHTKNIEFEEQVFESNFDNKKKKDVIGDLFD